jgi:hypothetical protein
MVLRNGAAFQEHIKPGWGDEIIGKASDSDMKDRRIEHVCQ